MAIIEFTIHVPTPEDVAALFDCIQVWRSPDETGSPTPFVDITANEATSAVVDGTVAGPWNLSGQTMTVIRDGAAPQPITFTGTNPLLLQDVLSQINAVFSGFASEVPTDTGRIRLKSPLVGTQSIIEVTGAATTTLGLSTLRTNGKAPRLLLSPNTEDYQFRDFDGQSTYWYKSRYYNKSSGLVSEFSTPRQGGPGTALSDSAVAVGRIALADVTGLPIVGRRIIFVPVSSQIVSDGGGNNYGILPTVDRIEIVTDNNGRAQVSLMKGQVVKVFIEGSSFQRQFTVPTTDFDILTVASSQPDPFSIVTSPPAPIRMS